MLIQFKGLATAVQAVSGGAISGYAGASLAALIMLAYDLAGGMRSVAWTDCLQVWAGAIPSVSACRYRYLLAWMCQPRANRDAAHGWQAVLMLGSFCAMLVLALTKFGGLPHAIEQTRAESPERTQTRPPEAVAEHLSACVLMLAFALYPHQVRDTYEYACHHRARQPMHSPQPSALLSPHLAARARWCGAMRRAPRALCGSSRRRWR